MMTITINPQPIINRFGRASQQAIADEVGVTRPTVSAWLNGKPTVIELPILEKFARACNAQPGDFFIMTDDA